MPIHFGYVFDIGLILCLLGMTAYATQRTRLHATLGVMLIVAGLPLIWYSGTKALEVRCPPGEPHCLLPRNSVIDLWRERHGEKIERYEPN